MTHKKALIVGVSGGIGQNLVQYLSTLEDWKLIGLSRRKPTYESTAQFIISLFGHWVILSLTATGTFY